MYFNGIPVWLAVSIAAGMAVSLAALHFLHRRYVRLQVPTLLFWRMANEIQRRNRLGGRFGRLLTFLLLAAIVLLLSLAMIRPSAVFGGGGRMRYIVIMDCRASMGILDDGQADCRLDRARQRCKKQMASFAESDEIVLIAVTDSAGTVCRATDSRTTCFYSLDCLQVTDSQSEPAMAQALQTAEALLGENEKSGILLFTDHLHGVRELSGKVKQKLSVFSYAKPVSNLALLGARIVRPDPNQIHLEVTAGYWGQDSMDGTLALYKGDTLLQSREISMASHTLSHSLFEVHEGDLPQLSVRAACQDGFQEDNQLVVSSDAGYILFVADDIPAPIRACVDANRVIQRKDRPDHADFPVAWADSVPAAGSAGIYVVRSPSSVQAAERILLTQHLYRNDQKRISMGYDLSAAFGSGLTGLSDRAVPLLTTSEGKIAAAVERFGEKASLFLDEGLFSEQSTVWKQPQFPELFQRWIELLYEYNGFRQKGEVIQRDPVYADLWTVDAGLAAEPQVPEPAGHAVSLYPWVLGLSLLFLGIETAAYYRGRIV